MSLQTDVIFVKALRSNSDLIEQLPAGDVYNTAIALPEEAADNAPIPYVIVSFDGLNTDDSTKDTVYDALTDDVQIGIVVVAKTRPQLAELVIAIRNTIRNYFCSVIADPQHEDFALLPNSYTFSANDVKYDGDKPCYWQVLTFKCVTEPDQEDEHQE